MREIPGTHLWLGNARDARDFTAIFGAAIEAVIDLAMEERPESPPRELIWLRIPLLDGAGNPQAQLRLAIQSVVQAIADDRRTLVACGGGMSRSPAITAAALAIHNQESLDDCLARIVEGAPHDVSPLLWRDVKQTCSPR
jgi:protein-tyrosine phosphatase